jgi:Fe-S-cluster containining protein
MSSPCSSCTKRCCANYTVSINGYDAWLISRRLRLPLPSFLVHFPVAEGAERGFRLQQGGTCYELALDKTGGFSRGNPCIFWIDLMNGRGRCGIYGVRPLVCQTYPAYQQEDLVLLRDDVMCPEGSWTLAGMDLPLFRRRLSSFRVEQDIYAALVSAWNDQLQAGQRPSSIDAFHTHLLDTYDRLERLRGTLPVEQIARLTMAWAARDAAAASPLVTALDLADVPGATDFLEGIRTAIAPPAAGRKLHLPLAAAV